MYGLGLVRYLQPLPQKANFLFLSCWLFAVLLNIYTMPIQFIYRYFALCRDKTLSLGIYMGMLLLSALIVLSTQIFLYHVELGEDFQLASSMLFPNSTDTHVIMLFGQAVIPLNQSP